MAFLLAVLSWFALLWKCWKSWHDPVSEAAAAAHGPACAGVRGQPQTVRDCAGEPHQWQRCDKFSKPCKPASYHRAGTALERAGEEEVAAGPWAPRAGFAKFIPGGAAAAWSFWGSQKHPMVLPWAELFCVVWAVIWQEVALLWEWENQAPRFAVVKRKKFAHQHTLMVFFYLYVKIHVVSEVLCSTSYKPSSFWPKAMVGFRWGQGLIFLANTSEGFRVLPSPSACSTWLLQGFWNSSKEDRAVLLSWEQKAVSVEDVDNSCS